jgi:transcriptional regulator with XRE-family HTH domain
LDHKNITNSSVKETMIIPSIHNEDNWGDDYTSPLIEELSAAVRPEEQEQTDYKMKLAAKIYRAMKDRDLNQTQFAEALGKQVSMVSRWLSGTHNFTVETLVDIQRVLGISLLNAETQQQQPMLNLKLKVTAAVPGWTPMILDQYISDMGGMAVTEKTIRHQTVTEEV